MFGFITKFKDKAVSDPSDWCSFTGAAYAEQAGFKQNYSQVFRRSVQPIYSGECRNCGAPIDSHQCSYCKTVHR